MTPPAASFKILIVEDEGIIANHIASRLAKTGYQVAAIAESSEEALACMATFEPELVLMDIHIKGGMDGIETALKIREIWDVPVIYLTAHSDHETIDRAKLTGASGFLTKPIHHTSLATSIEMAIYKHRADREIRHQRAWMSTALGNMANALIVLDSHRRVRFVNRLAEELTGWTDRAALGRELAEVLPLRDASTGTDLADLVSDTAPSRAPLPRGIVARKQSGKWFPIEGEIALSLDEGRAVGFTLTFRDGSVRQQEEAEVRQEYKMRAVGMLAAGIAHDFNNFLFVILGYTEELLRKAVLAESDRRAIAAIRNAGESASELTRQLLDFSRKEPAVKRDLNLNDVVHGTEELLRRLAGPNIKWQFRLDPNLAEVHADAGQLRQVLMNLVSNARSAMPDGGSITIETSNVEASRLQEAAVILTVTDTGTGMSQETADHLFEPFFTTRGEGKGTGLGLSIVYSIVSDLGGAIHVDSQPGQGASFAVCLPRVSAEAEIPALFSDGASGSVTVLLASEGDAVRGLIRGYLTAAGCNVLEAANDGEALRISREYPAFIDLLLTDRSVRSLGEFDVAREISCSRPGMKNIFISGYAADLMESAESLPGGARFLPRPFLKRDLLRNVTELMHREKPLVMRHPA
jgi:PAS domain S-box-containing protein